MAQFRSGSSGFFSVFLGLDEERWQKLEAGNETGLVECFKDSGLHGDGEDGDAVYAQRGGDVEPFTADSSDEIAWGSWPTNQSVTVYDGNYLNYLEVAEEVSERRIDIVNNTAKAILNSISLCQLMRCQTKSAEQSRWLVVAGLSRRLFLRRIPVFPAKQVSGTAFQMAATAALRPLW